LITKTGLSTGLFIKNPGGISRGNTGRAGGRGHTAENVTLQRNAESLKDVVKPPS
jgi:hypothetical protein